MNTPKTFRSNEFDFCWCGRPHPDSEVSPCQHHKEKGEPPKRIAGKRYSGDSSYRQNMGQFQAKEGR